MYIFLFDKAKGMSCDMPLMGFIESEYLLYLQLERL